MPGIREKLRQLYYSWWLASFQRGNPNVRLGNNIRLKGIPIFSVNVDSSVSIGNSVTFISRPESNMSGLNRRCSIAVGKGARLNIGDNCGFSAVAIYCAREIQIGANLTCGGNVSIWDSDFHPIDATARRNKIPEAIKTSPIVIGEDVFIGAHALILKGVTIGDRAVIGAGSVVTKGVPTDEIWAGNPAAPLKKAKNQV
jgi:acetyltransferase-like isoleucine patch superfamily enzyme